MTTATAASGIQTVRLAPNKRLTVTLAAASTALVERFKDDVSVDKLAMSASQTRIFGEYDESYVFRISPLTGSLTYTESSDSGQIVQRATQTNDDAAAGEIGEYKEASLAIGDAIALTSGAAANILSLSLTPGDWDVIGSILLHPAATTIVDNAQSGISQTSATIGGVGTYDTDVYGVTSTVDFSKHTPIVRVSLATAATVYLVSKSTFTVDTLSAYGHLRARRVR